MDRLLALRWSQRVFSWAHHDNSPQAWDNWSCMSHTHIRGNITFVVCVRLQTAPEIPFYGQGLCVCKCVYKYSDCVCVCESVSVLCGHITCASGGFSPVSECVFVYSPATAVINSCHYWQWGRCKSASPGPSDGLWDPSACWYTQPLRRNRDEALST